MQNSKKVFYHGTNKDFLDFDMRYATRGTKASLGLLGFFFTPNAELASDFCRNDWTSKRSRYKKGANIKPVHLNITNPYIIEPLEIIQISNGLYGGIEIFKEGLIRDGYDGVIINDDKNSKDFIKKLNEFNFEQYVAFYLEQIQSVFT